MKIAHIVSTFPPYFGGMGNVCYWQAKELAELGYEITVFTPWRGERFEIKDEKFKIQYLWPLLKYGNAALVPEIFIHLENFDIIHLHYPFIGGAEIIFFKKIFSLVPVVLQYQMDFTLPGFYSLISRLYNRSFNWWIMEKVEKIIVSSYDYAKESKYLSYLLEEDQEKIIEIPNGVDPEFFKPEKKKNKELLRRYHLSDKDKIILFVGGLDKAHYFKGLDILLKAISNLRSHILNVKLLIIGEGNLRPKYEKLAEKLAITKEVKFLGKIPQQELPTHYNLADVFVLPSINRNESFGLVLLEAMACGKPCVASNLAGVRTVVDNYKTGFLVKVGNSDDLAEKIEILLVNKNLAKKMGEAGRKKVLEKYYWKKIVKKLEELYKNIKLSFKK
ncbi:MAG: glycosyltransferase family 4 protein [Patescibacteria group bacterium]